jgi:hypothetical protein
MSKIWIILIAFFIFTSVSSNAQCLSAVNPVGGTDNLLVLEKNVLRIISFYKYGQGTQYFEGTRQSDFDQISKAYYNYLTAIIGFGLSRKLTLEIESGYFLNKTQNYNLQPAYSLTGSGLSNAVVMAKYAIYSEPFERIYITGAAGAKIPFFRELQWSDNGVELPVEVQPTIGAYGGVLSTSFVKESSGTGMRYFFTNRIEMNAPNREDYRLGTSLYNSFYISKHLMHPWLKDKWTAILQIRNEIRTPDKVNEVVKESSGSVLFFVSPQLNFVTKSDWYLSGMADLPVYQNFKGRQLGAGAGFTFILSKTFRL